MIRPVFHLSVLVIYMYTILYDQLYIVLPLPVKELENLPLQARSMFFTMWSFILQILYFFIALVNDVFGTDARAPKSAPIVRRLKDILFSLAFPVAVYVTVAFWSIYSVDKQLIFPDQFERLLPTWFNHVIHTTVAIFIVVELLTSYRNYPSRRTGITMVLVFSCTYFVWLFAIYIRTGAWVYPIFDILNWFGRIAFVVVSISFVLLLYRLGETLNSIVSDDPKENIVKWKN